ncbi:phospholipid metabolism enzyme regulator like [Lecanosticta acicola]|uniref:Phospholipid metabolism enzyme regulator like n=1 Tax=Lecanosticta acicola TaxID=111012 RepID=A0AAI8YYE3_9PEZI|nr:phospholipid metabolism enzyme regulator like [Lecanosticta acicola]
MASNSNSSSSNHTRSVSGQSETSEPATSNPHNNGANPSATRNTSHTQRKQKSSPPTPMLRKSSSSNLTPLVSSPLAQSPHTSRNTSPIRKEKSTTQGSGNLSSQPSAAAIQRALSASSVPQLQHQPGSQTPTVSEAVSKMSRGQRGTSVSAENIPSWPVSPRLKSPPPSGPNSRRGSAAASRKPDANVPPSIQVLSATPQSNNPPQTIPRQANMDNPKPEVQLQPPPPPKASAARGPSGKSMLETVQENSADGQEPSPVAIQASSDLKPWTKLPDEDLRTPKAEATKTEDPKPGESGSESAGNKSDSKPRGRRPSESNSVASSQAPRTKSTAAKPSQGSSTIKSRQGEGKQNMTVETETVQSIPQSGLAPASEGANRLRTDNNGTVKLKPSTETIRPKKERKKNERKNRSVNQGSATSKADLFEQRVANAVDEANTSDSDETFVYESNPPEPQRRQRHHSRTPSVTSSHSMADQQRGGMRNIGDVFDDRRVGGKRSMKFSSNPYQDVDSPESKDGTVRTHTPRHIGRFGRGGHHSASYDQQESPFTQASKLRQNHLQRSRPNSPKSPQSLQFRSGAGFLSGSRKHEQPYDFDVEQNADDERTPLVGSVRANRNYRSIRRRGSINTYMGEYSYQSDRQPWRCCNRRAGSCALTGIIALLVILSAIGFVIASNRPLQDIEIKKVDSVLATEQELMFDLIVGALNPNMLGVSVSDLDVNIFAKSKHVGMGHTTETSTRLADSQEKQQRRIEASGDIDRNPNPSQDLSGHWHAPTDHGPYSDIEKDAQTMLLGRVFHFDQAISFEGTPIHQKQQTSSGQVRLMQPGNKTESGGSARWEQIIQNPFELIVRGVLKYQLPISSRQQKAAVGASVMVHPEDGIDQHGSMRVEPVDHSEHWQWIEWPDLMDDDSDEAARIKDTDRLEELE